MREPLILPFGSKTPEEWAIKTIAYCERIYEQNQNTKFLEAADIMREWLALVQNENLSHEQLLAFYKTLHRAKSWNFHVWHSTKYMMNDWSLLRGFPPFWNEKTSYVDLVEPWLGYQVVDLDSPMS